ncbi:MAG: TraR/DksA C4-type zinc finger protein [Candidatus Moraniibacteriota bacterium]
MDAVLLEEMKARLEAEKKRLETELSRFAKPTGVEGDYETTFQDMGSERDENTSEVEEYVDNLGLETNLEGQLHATSEALSRVEAGSYGKCEKCGVAINPERLKAYPSASTCIEHAE